MRKISMFVPLGFVILVICNGCAANPAKVTIGKETHLSTPLFEPVKNHTTGEPELVFCADSDKNTLDYFVKQARRYRVQAEQAVERKEFAKAADSYRDALRVAPWWPEGHFNRALILAEQGRHALAIREMKRYLLLAPEAADTRAAQDQIYKWEALAR